MGAIASQITSLAIVYSIFYSGADQSKHQSSTSLAFVRGIHRDRWIPAQMASNAENISIWWRHHDFRHAIFKQILVIDGWDISSEIALLWRSLDLTDDQSTLVRQQAITWANVDPDLCRHMASVGHNELINNKNLDNGNPNTSPWNRDMGCILLV